MSKEERKKLLENRILLRRAFANLENENLEKLTAINKKALHLLYEMWKTTFPNVELGISPHLTFDSDIYIQHVNDVWVSKEDTWVQPNKQDHRYNVVVDPPISMVDFFAFIDRANIVSDVPIQVLKREGRVPSLGDDGRYVSKYDIEQIEGTVEWLYDKEISNRSSIDSLFIYKDKGGTLKIKYTKKCFTDSNCHQQKNYKLHTATTQKEISEFISFIKETYLEYLPEIVSLLQ